MLSWTQGIFELEPPDERAVLEEMQESTEGLLMEGMRQLDEYRVLSEKLPAADRAASPSRGRSSPSCAISSPEELDVFQAALERRHRARAVRRVPAHRPHHRREAEGAARQGLPAGRGLAQASVEGRHRSRPESTPM